MLWIVRVNFLSNQIKMTVENLVGVKNSDTVRFSSEMGNFVAFYNSVATSLPIPHSAIGLQGKVQVSRTLTIIHTIN